MQEVCMKVDDVECSGALRHPIEHYQMMRKGILASEIEPQCAIAWRPQRRLGPRVTARKQGDFMPLAYEFFGQIRDYPLGAAVKPRRTTFVQRGNLRNSHSTIFLVFSLWFPQGFVCPGKSLHGDS